MADIQQLSTARAIAEREVARTLRREKINAAVRYVILLFVGLLMLYPLVWMFSASFKPNHEIFTTQPVACPCDLGRFCEWLENRHRIQLRPLHAEHL